MNNPLLVIEQTDSIINVHGKMEITVDGPVDGPDILKDSIMAFLNKNLYRFCELCAHEYSYDDNKRMKSFQPGEVFTNDGEHLLEHYMERYKPIIKDSLWNTFFCMTLKMEAQTEAFVTYGLENFHCGGSCGSEKYYYTFDKRDGHIVREIIGHENLTRFFADYPEYLQLPGDTWMGWPGWEFSENHIFVNTDFGLGSDNLSMVITGVGNHYLFMDIPYSQILSYLNPEAQDLIEGRGEVVFPTDKPCRSTDGEVWMEVDTLHQALVGYVDTAGSPLVNTLTHYEPEMEIYPRNIYAIDTKEDGPVYLFIYSRGHQPYYDEALACVISEDGLNPVPLFSVDGRKDSVIKCMWHDQLVEASEGFPYDSLDENRFGIHYDWFTKRLYIPILDSHDSDSEFANTSCLQYTGRYGVLRLNGKEFVYEGTDGAWWLRQELRDYKRTVSNKRTTEGIEQIDMMPNGTFRHTLWKGAKTLDDLRKKPDKVKTKRQNDFIP